MHARERIEHKRMILHGNEAPGMAHHRMPRQAQRNLGLLMGGLVAPISLNVDAVRDDGEPIPLDDRGAETVEPRLARARHEVIGDAAHRTGHHLERQAGRPAIVVLRMAMRDSIGTSALRLGQVNGRAAADMPMYHAVFGMLGEKRAHLLAI